MQYDDQASELENIARALIYIGDQLKYLGNGNAATEMGAIEGLAMKVNEGLASIASAIEDARLSFK
jgi:hypothetical protein